MFTTITSQNVAGNGLAIVAGRLGLLVPADLSSSRIEALWLVMTSERALFEDVLTELVSHGVRELPDFALAEVSHASQQDASDETAEQITIAVRGQIVARSEGPRPSEIIGGDVDTWVETVLSGAQVLRFNLTSESEDHTEADDQTKAELEADIEQDRQPLTGGMSRTHELAWGVAPDFAIASQAEREAAEREAAEREAAAQAAAEAAEVAAAEAAAAEESDDLGGFNDPESPEELTVMSRRVRRSGHESIDGHTVLRSPKRVARWLLRFETGQVIGVGGRVVVGRKPSPTGGTAHGVEQLEQLLSLRREISANHALLIPEEDGVRVADLHSTNGTVVRPRDGSSVLLTDGAEYVVKPGDRVNFGDDNIAICERAPLQN